MLVGSSRKSAGATRLLLDQGPNSCLLTSGIFDRYKRCTWLRARVGDSGD